jgi:hypothetical protein
MSQSAEDLGPKYRLPYGASAVDVAAGSSGGSGWSVPVQVWGGMDP